MFYFSALRQFFSVVVYNAAHFSALSPTTQKNVPRCCLQCRSFFCVVGNNAEKCSNFSSCVFFRVVAHNTNNFSALRQQHRKIIYVGAYNMEKWSALLTTTRKHVLIRLSPRVWNQMRIETRVSIMGLGWCVSWRKVVVKNLVGLSL